MIIDTHCHINFESYDKDRDEMLARAVDLGVTKMVCIGMMPDGGREALAMARKYPGQVYASVGAHPYDATKLDTSTLDEFRALLAEPEMVMVGEMGIDCVKAPDPIDVQERAFEMQLELAGELDLPVCVHSRDAFKLCEKVIRKVHPNGWKGFAHCFSDGPEEALAWKEMGFKISFAGQITFKNKSCDIIREAVKVLTPDDVVVETDAPFITPAPNRGRRNEPGFTRYTAEKIAEIWGMSAEEVFAATTKNASEVLGF
ncbi:MAG: TatD family hydrolase [Planctomycetes bacterium]|nr:TatD family hydrolase [Planctomycetota bacterium]